MKKLIALLASIALTSLVPHGFAGETASDESLTVKGEIVDLACYTDHGASGEKHAGCAAKCISSGLPVGIKGEDGTVYMVIGSHKPMNAELAEFAGKVITLKGKLASRDGIKLLENAEIVK